MTGSASTSGTSNNAPAGDAGAAAAAGDQTNVTALGGDSAKPGDAAKPADGAAAAKPAEGDAKPADGAKAPDDKAAKPGDAKAPEKYADFKMPDGIAMDAKAVEAFSPILRELNLNQDQAQKLVDVYAKNIADASTAYFEQLKDDKFALEQVGQTLGHQRSTWSAALKADAEIGGKDFDKNLQRAQRAIARFGSPALKQLLNVTGLGNHPEFVRFALKAGHMVQEDGTALGAPTGASGKKSTADVFYGDKAG